MYSDGTNWIVQGRSPTYFNSSALSVTTSSNISARLDFTNSYLFLSPTNNTTVTIPQPTTTGTNKLYKVENTSQDFTITLSITTLLFSGAYGSEATTLILPANSWIEMYSNGTNWICVNVSNYGWTYPIVSTVNPTITLPYQWFRTHLSLTATQQSIFILPTVKPSYYQEGLQLIIRKIMGNASQAPTNSIQINATSTGLNTLYIGNQGAGAFPLTGNSFVNWNNNNGILRVIRTSVAGGGSCVVNPLNAKMIYLNPSSGVLSVGTVLTIAGSPYTIRGMGGLIASGGTATISATTGASTFTALNTTSAFGSYMTIGSIFTVAGANYTITSATIPLTSAPSATQNVSYTSTCFTFTPTVPSTWNNEPITPAVFSPYTTAGLYGAGVYYLDTAVSPTTTLTYTNNTYYSWALIL
jgi:hypothetical protein